MLRGLALGPLELPEWLELLSFPPAKAMAVHRCHQRNLLESEDRELWSLGISYLLYHIIYYIIFYINI